MPDPRPVPPPTTPEPAVSALGDAMLGEETLGGDPAPEEEPADGNLR